MAAHTRETEVSIFSSGLRSELSKVALYLCLFYFLHHLFLLSLTQSLHSHPDFPSFFLAFV